ncbi:MAG: AAA family ATPase [Chloroflexi bacterium]|nr:AAA family ATPase [Chloroflexota bacterium]
MSVPVLTFFNNKGGVGKTSLVYHLAWMYAELGVRVVAADLDPQANLTSMFLAEERLEAFWLKSSPEKTIYGALQPLLDGTGDVTPPCLEQPGQGLALVVGDLKLSSAEGELSSQWPACLDRQPRAFRVISALWRILQKAAAESDAEIVLVDVGPNLGALNRAVLVATDFVVVPLAADLYSLQGLRNLGPTLRTWRAEWSDRSDRNPVSDLPMPKGRMQPIGYVVQQHGVRLSRPVQAYDKWINRMPEEYAESLLGNENGTYPGTPEDDENSLATVKHYRSLVPMAQESRKPIFKLAPADGARGAHATAARDAYTDFKTLADKIKALWSRELAGSVAV